MMNRERVRFLSAAGALTLLLAAGLALWVIDSRMDKNGAPLPDGNKLGLSVQTLTTDFAARLGMKDHQGTMVTRVQPDSPAARAGLKQGDIVLEVNHRKVADAAAFWRVLAQSSSDERLLLIKRADSSVLISLSDEQSRSSRH